MITNWDELLITIVDPDSFLVTEDEHAYSLRAEQRMIIFMGEPGIDGQDGKDGKSIVPCGQWNPNLEYHYLDLVFLAGNAYVAKQDVPLGILIVNEDYWMLTATGGDGSGSGLTTWGEIFGSIENQADLQEALAAKASMSDLGALALKDTVDYDTEITNKPTLGTMSAVNDAPSDGLNYNRKNGEWVEASSSVSWGEISGTIGAQTDLVNALNEKLSDAPSDDKEYVRKNGAWAESSGGGGGGITSVSWGDIEGTLTDQTDLTNALNAKADTADLGALAEKDTADYETDVTNKPILGTMAGMNDAPSDGKSYNRKNGAWTEATSSVSWGEISGTIGAQTDLANALNTKANTADLGALATKDTADYETDITNKPTLGTMSEVNDAPSDSKEYVRKNGSWAEKTDSVSWGDITGTLSNQIDLQNAIDGKAPVIVDTVPVKLSGTYIVVPVGARPIDFKATLQVTQTGSGTPSASNIRPFESAESCIVVTATEYGDVAMEMLTQPIPLPSVMYGGIVDVLNGTVIITHGHIASYNGETLPGVWYSDRDVYASGTTPTVGAEVVYELETPIEQTCSSRTPTMNSRRDTYLWASHQSQRLSVTNYTVAGAIDIYEQEIADTKTYIDQNDALKANVADLGDLAYEDDAPSDNAEYVRKNGSWAVSSGGGGTTAPTWGAITGTLSQQTDLQNALNAKANTADLGALADHDTVDYATELTNKPTFGSLASKDSVNYETEVTNKPTLGTMAGQNDAPSDNVEYVRKNGAWAVSSGGGGGGGGTPTWGTIVGTLSNQTDLADALDAKADASDLADESKLAHHTYYVKGTQTASTGSWTGDLPEVDALYEGLAIDYYLPYAGSGNATLNLTLKGGAQTGAVPCYQSSTSRLTTQAGPNNICRLVYQTVTINDATYTGWWIVRAPDANDTAYRVRIQQRLASASVIYRFQLLFHTDTDTVTPLNNVNNSTGIAHTMLTNVDFDPFGRIYYYSTTNIWNASTVISNADYLYTIYSAIDLRISLNCGSTLTTNELIYLKVIPQSNGMVRLAPDPCWAQSLPTTNDGYWYILLGRAHSTYQLSLFPDHPVYYHDGTRIMQAQPQNMALTGTPTAPTPASGDDSTRIATTEWVTDAVSGKADTADLGDLASLDSIDYTSNKLTNKPTLGAMASQSDAPSDSKEYVRKNGAWAESSSGGGGITSVSWGDIEGTLQDQTDLKNALDKKASATILNGTTSSGVYIVVPSGEEIIDLKATYNVTQTGSGTPSASNIRPFESTEYAIIVLARSYEVFPSEYISRNIQLPSTIYGGVVDVINGLLTITHGHIASYNGETLPGVWYSDRDEYVAGTTPTVGAEVVYELETPVYQSFTGGTPALFQSRDTYVWVTHQNYVETKYTVTGTYGTLVPLKDYIDSNDSLKANVADLGSLATQDTVDYATEVTNKPALGTMSAVNDAPSDSKEYVRKNGVWAEKSSDPVSWGDVSGTLANQTDLATALDAKANVTDLADESKLAHHTYYVKGTQTGTTGNWTGDLPEVDALYEGLSIDYYLPYAGSGHATLNLTLKGGVQTGAVPCYYGSTGRLTTQIPQYYVCHLTYQTVTINNVEYTGWYISRAVDNDGIGQNLRIVQILKADSAIYRYQLLFHTDVDIVTPLNNVNNSTGTSKAMLTNVDFDAFARIYFYNSTTTVNAGQYTAQNYALYYQYSQIDLRCSINCGSTLTVNELIYLKVIPQSNGMVRLAPDPCWAQELPTTADGYWYILLGRAYNTYQLSLFPDHPVYYHDGTRIMQAQPPNMALTGAPTAPTPASGDDSTRIATTEWVTDAVSGKADTADLGALATLDNIDYTSSKLINKPTLGAMASQSDAPSDSKEYVRKNGQWSEATGGITSVAWGDVTGTLSDQTDLATALNAKVSKAGDTMTGMLAIKSNNIVKTPTVNSTGNGLYLLNASGNTIGQVYPVQTATGEIALYARVVVVSESGGSTQTSEKLVKLIGWDGFDFDSGFALAEHNHDSRYYTSTAINDMLHGKQNVLTFDSTPTASSTNPVESGGVKTALDAKQDTLTFDSTPTASSTNPVESGGVKDALDTLDDAKVSKSGDTMTGNLVIEGSNNTVGLEINLSGDSARGGIFRFMKGEATERVYVYHFKNNNTNYDLFKFPATTHGETSNGTYELLSTKNVVTIEQGGTGATGITGSNGAVHNLFPTNLTSTIQYLTGMTQNWASTGYVKLPLPVALGGTGSTNNTGWKTVTASTFSGSIYYRVIGPFVCIAGYQLKLASELSSSSVTLIAAGSSPFASYKPKEDQSFPAGNIAGFGQIVIGTTGAVTFYRESSGHWSASRNINFSGFYAIA